jgi:hypothetical protein
MTNKTKTTSLLKSFLIELFSFNALMFLALIVLIVNAATSETYARSNQKLNNFTICTEAEKGQYDNINKLLKPNSTLKEIKFNSNGEPTYTGQQLLELSKIVGDCAINATPFGLFTKMHKELKDFTDR